ncbi:DedA family protein [Actinoplanes sp. NPDC049802]|uniref:DedA family protein n=1 Tax=Actinoplanes sp. NPDC049802 TaxID=3154742 RepID=UPI003405D5DD
MRWLNDLLGGLPPALVCLVVGVVVTAETALLAGLVLPAATALVAMGLLANAGVVPVGPALLTGVAAAVLGGNIAYTRAGTATADGGRRAWDRAERLFARHGGRAVFLGQWVVGARTLMPRLAARNGVPRKVFLAWHTPAAILWALWMVGASYAAGASYDVLAARAGRAAGALAALTVLTLGLMLAGRWLGGNPGPVRAIARRILPGPLPAGTATVVSLALLVAVALLLIAVIPPVVRFSGLGEVDETVAAWARSEWTSDGYFAALQIATSLVPEILVALALIIALARWWRHGLDPRAFFPEVLGPILPAVVLAVALAVTVDPGSWATEFPPASELDGSLPLDARILAAHSMPAGQTAQVAAAAGLLAWMMARNLPWKWRVTVWTLAAGYTLVCAGSWVYLNWSDTSTTVAAVVLGVAWAAVNAAVWSSRADGGTPAPRPEPVIMSGSTV